MPKVENKLTRFQKCLIGISLVFILTIAAIVIRQQEISRCKSFYTERKEKLDGRIDFLRFDNNFSASYKWCDWILYGWRK